MNISSPARQQPLSTSSRTELWLTYRFLNPVFIFNFILESKPFQMFLLCSRLTTGRTVRRSNPGGGEIFRTCADRLWGPPSLLYNGYGVFPGVKRPGCGVDHPPPSSAEVKERVELCMHFLSGPWWSVLGWTLPFTFTLLCRSESSYDECLSLCIIHAYSGAALTSHLHVPFNVIRIYWLLLPYSQLCVRLFEVTPSNGVRNLIMCPFFYFLFSFSL